MIIGRFGDNGELWFEIEVIAVNQEIFPLETLLDTGFTTGWLTMDLQDIQSLGWRSIEERYLVQTVRGEEFFPVYEGQVRIDRQEFTIPVIATFNLPENLLGLQWLKTRKLIVDYPASVLTLD